MYDLYMLRISLKKKKKKGEKKANLINIKTNIDDNLVTNKP